jgi:hypothetical protein
MRSQVRTLSRPPTSTKFPVTGRLPANREEAEIARAEKIPTIVTHIFAESAPMPSLARCFHFTSVPGSDPGSYTAILPTSPICARVADA